MPARMPPAIAAKDLKNYDALIIAGGSGVAALRELPERIAVVSSLEALLPLLKP